MPSWHIITRLADDCGPDIRYIGREICFNYNTDTLTIVDVTNKTAPVQLSRTGYSGSKYTHQGWLTDDRRHVIVNDELDEAGTEKTKSYIFNVRNLTNPIYVGHHSGTTTATDHNLYIKGNLVFQTNFRAGLQVLRIDNLDMKLMTQVGNFDIYPSDDSDILNGAWGNYPYFPSGNIIVSGIEQGLYVLKSPNNFGLTAMPTSPTSDPTSAKPTYSSRPTTLPSISKPTSTKPSSPPLISGQMHTISIDFAGRSQTFFIAVPRSYMISCRTAGITSSSGDPDLYVKFDAQPTLHSYDAASLGRSYDELVGTFAASTTGDRTLYVLVYAFTAFVNAQLRCDLTTSRPTASPTTRRPTTRRPTASPTTRRPTTRRPSSRPTTRAPTTRPTSFKPTARPI